MISTRISTYCTRTKITFFIIELLLISYRRLGNENPSNYDSTRGCTNQFVIASERKIERKNLPL